MGHGTVESCLFPLTVTINGNFSHHLFTFMPVPRVRQQNIHETGFDPCHRGRQREHHVWLEESGSGFLLGLEGWMGFSKWCS